MRFNNPRIIKVQLSFSVCLLAQEGLATIARKAKKIRKSRPISLNVAHKIDKN